MKYELHALASNLSLHNPVVKYTNSSATGGCPTLNPEESDRLCAKLLVGLPSHSSVFSLHVFVPLFSYHPSNSRHRFYRL